MPGLSPDVAAPDPISDAAVPCPLSNTAESGPSSEASVQGPSNEPWMSNHSREILLNENVSVKTSFSSLLAEILQSGKEPKVEAKKRVSAGSEVITSPEAYQRLLDRKEAQKKTKQEA